MTPLIRSVVRYMDAAGLDPTEMQWFDASGCMAHRDYVPANVLMEHRPPFERCMVCWSGESTNYKRMEMFMLTVGSDPREGITMSVWRQPPGLPPVASPMMVYAVIDGQIKYGPVDEMAQISEAEAQTILGFLSAWYASLSRRCEAYRPTIKSTFTNRRKMAAGKPPLYDWHTVVIEPVRPTARTSNGGTHASPRFHDRRGHIRRLQSGRQVWVRPCKVGDPTKGAVFKDYAIADVRERIDK